MSYLKVWALMLLAAATANVFASESAESLTVNVTVSEMKFEVEGLAPERPLILQAGQRYTLVFENKGAARHEVLWGREVVREQGSHHEDFAVHMLAGLEVDVLGPGFEVEAFGLKELELDPRAKLSVSFTLPEALRGQWEMSCFAPGHYGMGMKIPVVVQ